MQIFPQGIKQAALDFIHFSYPGTPFKQLEQYLEISPTPRVGQKLREAQMQFWAEILSANFRQWQQKQKGRKAQEEL